MCIKFCQLVLSGLSRCSRAPCFVFHLLSGCRTYCGACVPRISLWFSLGSLSLVTSVEWPHTERSVENSKSLLQNTMRHSHGQQWAKARVHRGGNLSRMLSLGSTYCGRLYTFPKCLQQNALLRVLFCSWCWHAQVSTLKEGDHSTSLFLSRLLPFR